MIQDSRFKNREDFAHHAYAVEGGSEARAKLFEMLEISWEVVTKGNPDFLHRQFETLGIDEARNLKELQEKKSFASGGRKIFVIEAEAITAPAQNSLLKMFEEPTPNTHFFLIGRCVKNLIPTLESRLSKTGLGEAPPPQSGGGAKAFLAFTTTQRLALVKKLADDIKDEKKTKTEAFALIHQIEDALYQKSKKEGALPPEILRDIELCREYMSDPSASVKMLLEYVALVAPRRE
ncbi:MAG: hypothetical protein HYV67_02740 [Candidatus Taylorbacteria bacterium]|nr:hypothetical protein [Candidatus Taylorbacteria bacterium]